MTWAPCPHGVRTRGKKTNQLHGLRYKKGLFHGMQQSYRHSILTWMQPALEHCDTPDLHRDHGFAAGHL